ncbi:cytochrome c [Viridibacterium curvum]|uniref:Cytochrome c domain-containing protein n=1 Tax=Viridibacterium curvum TaxID=1101404 RepID=A0ABP9QAX3_9RHOO
MKTKALILAASLGLTTLTAHAAEGRPEIAKKKISMCIGCHGIPGYQVTFPTTYKVPKLGGQHAAYIVSALQAYKSGDRKHPDMNSIAASLSEQDMADIAAYYAKK